MQYEMSHFSITSLKYIGELELKTGIHTAAGAVSTEFVFKDKEVVMQ